MNIRKLTDILELLAMCSDWGASVFVKAGDQTYTIDDVRIDEDRLGAFVIIELFVPQEPK